MRFRTVPLLAALLLAGVPAAAAAEPDEMVLILTPQTTTAMNPPPPGVCGSGVRAYALAAPEPNTTAPVGKAYGTFSLPAYACYTEFSMVVPEPTTIHGPANVTFAVGCDRAGLIWGRQTVGIFPLGGDPFMVTLWAGHKRLGQASITGPIKVCQPGTPIPWTVSVDVPETDLPNGEKLLLSINHVWAHPEPEQAPNFYFITGGPKPAGFRVPLGPANTTLPADLLGAGHANATSLASKTSPHAGRSNGLPALAAIVVLAAAAWRRRR